MDTIRGTYLNGMIVPDVRPEWVDGSRVSVNLADHPIVGDENDPDEIAKRLAAMDGLLEVPPMPDEEVAEWERQRAQARARELASWNQWTRTIGAQIP